MIHPTHDQAPADAGRPVFACATPGPTSYLGRPGVLTLADLLAELARLGADPVSVTFRTSHGPVLAHPHDYDLCRVDGALVVTFGPTPDLEVS